MKKTSVRLTPYAATRMVVRSPWQVIAGKRDDCEFPAAEKLLKESADFIENATITSDALHTPKERIA